MDNARMSWINYHHLYYFHTIAHQGTIAKASKSLRLGQSALSSQLKQLEESLDAKLFERKAQRLTLTPVGELVLGYADVIFKIGTEMLEAVKESRSKAVQLDIGILDSVPKSIAHQFVTTAIERGNCYVSVTEATNDELFSGLLAHRLHLVLTNSHAPVVAKSDFFSRCVGDLPVVICGSSKFKKLVKNFPQSLEGQPFILPTSQSKLRNDLEHFFEMHKVRPHIIGDSQESELDKRLAISGHALIALSSHGLESTFLRGKLLCIGTIESIREQIWLSGVRRHFANPIAAELLNSFELSPDSDFH